MKKFDTLLFDLDGTLTDSTEGILNCLIYAIERMGFEVPEDTNIFLGPPIRQSFAEFLGMNGEQVDEAVRIFRERYSDTGLFENRVYDGIPGMLERLKSGGKRLMVATSKPQVYAVRIFERFGLAQYFEIVGGAELDGSRDYKDEVIEYVLAKAGITDRSTVLMIGDRRQDVLGAHKTDIECMGILWGYGSVEELTQAGADYIARTPQEAADMLLS
ncbi:MULTISPECIES: HAD hydrolase-like protein [Ruminococcus]|jgi:phosphoglycolate phosphatase|uniref:Phosphoglycolate phosphatase n=1 Tax=Ruminococcus flavefaciens TaxID=1265 RepID=A0A315Y0D9_RUMFL|nr:MULTISPECIES: HAD hydrolase-like protein [Ruminococcus]MBR1429830.1 HAD hydrolase-like protein [Ruminococcus sp.]PWJ13616.1 phosphoglycolate phosphatase [Ruminococcus flavefaciens]SSA48216.1 phosphoglycolate phosphatase [Ruminococcus flavefaciens]